MLFKNNYFSTFSILVNFFHKIILNVPTFYSNYFHFIFTFFSMVYICQRVTAFITFLGVQLIFIEIFKCTFQ